MANSIGGILRVTVDGDRVLVRGGVTTNVGQLVVREPVEGSDGFHGFTEKIVTAFIEVELTEKPDFPMSKLNTVTNSTVVAELQDGRTVILPNAAQVGELTWDLIEGSLGTVRFVAETGTVDGP